MSYRPEIDGLRAIAVIAVVIYHAKIQVFGIALLQGGYIGVDIFFVISGYLIGRNIFSEHSKTQKIDFWSFYERRARRLLPVLLTVLTASLIASWFVLLPSSFVEFAKSVPTAILFVSNFFFLAVTTSYGAEDSLFKPLLHTWTLSLEEQFYILFPIVVVGLLRLGHATAVFLAAIALLSFAYAQWMAPRYPENNFFLLPGRVWELLVGALLAYLEVYRKPISLGRVSGFLAILGLGLLGASMVLFSATTLHPGLPTLAPVLGAALVIQFASSRNRVGRFLTYRPFVGLGLISYSLYLWHFPIFAFIRVSTNPVPVQLILFGTLLAVLLSILSYRFIELPFRDRKTILRPVFTRSVAYYSMALCFVCALIYNRHGDFGRFDFVTERLPNYQIDNAALEDARKQFIIDIGARAEFVDQTIKVLIIGNSHAEDLFSALVQNSALFPNLSFQLYVIQLACFNEDRENTRAFFESSDYQVSDVVLVAPQYATGRRCQFGDAGFQSDLSGLEALVSRLKRDRKPVALASNSVEFAEVGSETLIDSIVIRALPRTEAELEVLAGKVNRAYYANRNTHRPGVGHINTWIEGLAEREGLPYLFKEDFICSGAEQTCAAMMVDGTKLFTDHSHMSIEGARHLGKEISTLNWLGPIMDLDGLKQK